MLFTSLLNKYKYSYTIKALLLLLPKLPLVAGVPQQGHVPLEEHQLFEVGAGQGGPFWPQNVTGCREYPLHGSGAREGVLYLMNKSTHASLCSLGNQKILTNIR